MNRNTEAHFSKLPNVEIQRSLFDRSTQNKLSFNAGLLIPIFADEYLPGDTFTMDTSIVIRTTSAMIKPVMDNMYADIYYFSVPNRLVWNHWKEFMGENNNGPWVQTTEYTIPQVVAPSGGWNIGTLADYFGLPVKVSNISVSDLFFRAYSLIWNEYFRDENLMNLTDVPKTDATIGGVNTGTLETDACKGGLPLPVCKFHDYFTSALPNVLKAVNEVTVGTTTSTTVPVYGNNKALQLVDNTGTIYGSYSLGRAMAKFTPEDTEATLPVLGLRYNYAGSPASMSIPIQTGGFYTGVFAREVGENGSSQGTILGVPNKTQLTQGGGSIANSGLVADMEGVSGISINALRTAFALQRLYEKDARGGTRYIEMIKTHFNVTSPDARLQRPEYLGGKRIPININQVVQMSGTESASGTQQTPQGNVSAYSLTADKSGSFTKSFTEHGMIIGLLCVRTEKTYQQGINKMFSRQRRFEFYFPSLSHLGELPVKNKEIYAQGTTADDETFGFQEAWAEYRYKPSQICGEMRSAATNSLDVYHFADNYASKPILGQSWIQEDKANIDRTLAVTSSNTNQFIADIYFSYRCARPMPVYSVPGLLDHF